jgi:signal transduction histidine kinase
VSGDPWTVRSFNQTANLWFGDELAEGTLLSDLIPSIKESALRRRLKKGRDARFDYEIELARELPVEFVCTQSKTIEDAVILEGIDQTRARSSELMLTSYSKMIEEKNRELEAAIQARDHFFSTMSHELRTPLNSIIGFSESLLDEIYGDLDEEQIPVIEKIYSQGHNLMSLLSSLLNLSRIRSGNLELNLKPLDLREICEQSIFRFQHELEQQQMSASCELEELTVLPLVDEQWCHQLLDHLISNAIKFSPSGSPIGIKLSSFTDRIRITVWDKGIGVHPTYHKKIFQPFTQVDSSLARRYDGSGLGLSVVAEVMRLHGGVVSVESEGRGGSQFHLDFLTKPMVYSSSVSSSDEPKRSL